MCNVMEEIIEAARAQDLATTPEERAADERLQRFCGLYETLESKPDGDLLLAQAEAILKVLAGGRLVEPPPAAPVRSKRTELIFARFAEATMKLVDCEDTPEGVQKAIGDMVDYFANELDGTPPCNGAHAYRVMANVFELDKVDDD